MANTSITQSIKVIHHIESICPTAEIKRVDSKKGIILNSNLDTSTDEHFDVLESLNEFITVERITINVKFY